LELTESTAHVEVEEALACELAARVNLRLCSVLLLKSLLQDRGSGLQSRLHLLPSANERATADEAPVEPPVRNVAGPEVGADAE
jgi:hypothetical protein